MERIVCWRSVDHVGMSRATGGATSSVEGGKNTTSSFPFSFTVEDTIPQAPGLPCMLDKTRESGALHRFTVIVRPYP